MTVGKVADDTVLDDLVATDMVNHAAGPQGRDGLKTILRTIEVDLGPTELEQHHLIGAGGLVVQHVTLHGTHRASTMPLLADAPVTGRSEVRRAELVELVVEPGRVHRCKGAQAFVANG